LLSRIRRPPKIHLAKSVIFGQPELQVAVTNNDPNSDKHHSRGLLQKVSKANTSCALGLDKHHRGSRTTPHTPSLSHLTSRTLRTIPDITTKIPAQATSDYGHLEDHQRLIKRRSRAARKVKQGGSKVSS
jgi:hypothetical protein